MLPAHNGHSQNALDKPPRMCHNVPNREPFMSYSIGDYPLPAHAIYAWIEGENLRIGLPPIEGNERGHSVAIPLAKCEIKPRLKPLECSCGRTSGKIEDALGTPATDQLGWKALLDILHSRVRDHASQQEYNRIARKSAPIQSQIDEWIKSKGVSVFSQEGHRTLSDKELDDLLSE